tara:strand:+ start:53 stop:394 length:342 start_codon:yes stop_codon:yes gene_type:complete
MRLWILVLVFPFSLLLNAQSFKEDISVVQFSAPFTVDGEISLKPFKNYSTYTFYITEKGEIFKKEKINFLPTVILYNNGKEIIRIESDITLSLPENCSDTILYHIEKLIESKF